MAQRVYFELRAALLGVLCALWLAPLVPFASPSAHAQEAPAEEAAMARTLFLEGTRAAKAGAWARARDAFSASYALHPSPRTLFNLGIARAALGEFVAASEALRAFLRQADGEREADNLAIARRELARIEPQIAYLRVEASEASEGDQLEVDGRVLPRGTLGTELPLDPGPHRIRLLRPEQVAAEQEVALEPGERTQVSLVPEAVARPEAAPLPALAPSTEAPPPLPSAPVLATSPMPAQRDEDGRKRTRRWIIGGAVLAAVVGGGLGAYFALQNRDQGAELELVDSNVTDGVLRVP